MSSAEPERGAVTTHHGRAKLVQIVVGEALSALDNLEAGASNE